MKRLLAFCLAPLSAEVTVDGGGAVKAAFTRVGRLWARVKDFFKHLFW